MHNGIRWLNELHEAQLILVTNWILFLVRSVGKARKKIESNSDSEINIEREKEPQLTIYTYLMWVCLQPISKHI